MLIYYYMMMKYGAQDILANFGLKFPLSGVKEML